MVKLILIEGEVTEVAELSKQLMPGLKVAQSEPEPEPEPERKKTRRRRKPAKASARRAEPEPEPEVDEPEPEEEGGGNGASGAVSPAEFQDARRLHHVVQRLLDKGYDNTDEIVALCESLAKDVPLLGRIRDLPRRVAAAVEMLQG